MLWGMIWWGVVLYACFVSSRTWGPAGLVGAGFSVLLANALAPWFGGLVGLAVAITIGARAEADGERLLTSR